MTTCYRCGSPVSMDGVGLNQKLVNCGVREFLCLKCLAAHFMTTEEKLLEMIERFRAAGCHLFAASDSQKP